MFSVPEVKFLDGTPDYFVIEDIGKVSSINDFRNLLYEMKTYAKKKNIPSVKIILGRDEVSNTDFVGLLEEYGLERYDVIHYYKRDLTSLETPKDSEAITLKPVDQTNMELFKELWENIVSASLNTTSSLSIEKEFQGMKSELGPGYIKSCIIAYDNKTPIGITIPHIEPRTVDEGRLFYFGVVPEYHSKRMGTQLHKLSLEFLKDGMGATYYIGATGHRNIPMQRIFQINGCEKFEEKIVYKL
ncbi:MULTISPECIES: GNAT family N-acetyltransferase [Salimicrobium]|uniref:N-acetyltransferase domain-containing protein n=1 Tax=Salimicrobium humidisoli TaxID=2029857 RepID=A0ABX4HNA0_9BACI|nr:MULTISPECIES: GNAT family N-acetyltransferase [Salimicrobium]PBB04666.1 hypothetical protein CKW00_12900 [Salimicrobium humidisoli]